jgi:quercetin dioxygenase-like cupin family protein
MFISHEKRVERVELSGEQLKGVNKQLLIGPEEGWESHVMRQFHLATGGHTPRHTHPWPHINYVSAGKGTLFLQDQEHPIEKGSIAYVPPGTLHQFMADQGEELSFICIVPIEGEG